MIRLALPVALTIACAAATAVAAPQQPAHYLLETQGDGMHWHVQARLPIQGSALRMEESRPLGVAELDSAGWPGLVRSLRVTLADGKPLAVSRAGDSGWRLARPETTTVQLEYDIDLSPLAREHWPAPREAAHRDSSLLSVVGRALFVTTAASGECAAEFRLPRGWTVHAPWRESGAGFRAASARDLVDNLVLIASRPVSVVQVDDFRVRYAALGWWRPAEPRVRSMLERVVKHHVNVMRSGGHHDYLVLLLPQRDQGAESYRASSALTVEARPDSGSSSTWGNLIAHELFHQWNGWQLQGADYASTQWFQEGFTEYEANRAMLDLDGEAGFRTRLAVHVGNSRKLATTLENIGSRKGPPLYSAGALVAFLWDVRIRAATEGRRNLSDFFRELLRVTDQGRRPHGWPDLSTALKATAPGDWDAFHARFIAGSEPLPLADAFSQVGQRVVENENSLRLEPDPTASAEATRHWRQLVEGD